MGTGLVPRGSVFMGLCLNQQTSYFSGHKTWWLLWCWRFWDHRSRGLDLWTQSGQHWTMLWVQPSASFQNVTWDQLKPLHPEISTCTHICTHIHTQIRFFFLSKPNSCFLHVSTSFSLRSSRLDASRMKAVSVFYLTTRRISFLFHKIWLFSLKTFQKCGDV